MIGDILRAANSEKRQKTSNDVIFACAVHLIAWLIMLGIPALAIWKVIDIINYLMS
jgi:hypothetical protein